MDDIQIYHVPHFNGNPSPARCNRSTGEIWINDSVWLGIKPAHRLFILLHELGHIHLNTSDELAVDKFASHHYIKMGYSLNESVKSLSRILTGTSPQHIDRVRNQIERATEIDKLNNQTMNILSNQYNSFKGSELPWYEDSDTSDYDELFGLGKKAKARREEKHAIKMDKKRAKNEIKLARADAKRSRGEAAIVKATAKEVLAQQGIVDTSGVGGVIGNIVDKVTGGGQSQEEPMSMQPKPTNPKSKSKTMMWVAIVGGVLVVGVCVTFFFIKKRK